MLVTTITLVLNFAASRPAPRRHDIVAPVAWREHALADARGGAAFPALMQTADSARSELDFVGMMIRCQKGRLEPLLIILDPLPPRSEVSVDLATAGKRESYKAALIPTGAGVAVAADLEARLMADWADEPDLEIAIHARERTINGVVALRGLTAALSPFALRCKMSEPPR